MIRAVDIIRAKRDGEALSREAIDAFIAGVGDGSWADYQVSALLMAIVLRGMTAEETAWLTDAMVRSGRRVDLSSLPGIKVGKHSTGGVGDKISIVLAPVVAACGIVVAKMSGRGLGHTGGTLDKLEAIPGFRISLTSDEFLAILKDVGCCLISQTRDIAPADKTLYGAARRHRDDREHPADLGLGDEQEDCRGQQRAGPRREVRQRRLHEDRR